MIGLIVQLTAEFCKIWSISSLRIITYTRDDLPHGSHEGNWIEIEFNSSGVMKGIKKVEDILETRRDERGKMQVLDIFLVDSQREEAFCETFGVVRIARRKGGEIKWIEERKTKDHCIHLWMTISSNAQFSIEEQSLDRANSKDGKYSEKYSKLLDEFEKMAVRSPRNEISDERREFDETILIVGFDHKSKRFFSSSRCGEAFINESIWIGFNQEKKVEKGDAFRARICKIEDDAMRRVVKLYERVELGNGVGIHLTPKDMSVELNGVVMERRQTCFALETKLFGLVTYSVEKSFLHNNLNVGDRMRVILHRYKKEVKADHPSKWQVTRVVEMLEKRVEEKIEVARVMDMLPSAVEEEKEWFEGIVTSMNGARVFISFKHGNAQYNKTCDDDIILSLGTVVDICVRDTGFDSFFDVCEIDNRTRKRDDIRVEKNEEKDRAIFTVICQAEVIERRGGYFLLDTPIIGMAQFFFGECPDSMRVGDIWNVKMHRRKDKRDLPSHWVVHEVEGDSPRSTAMETGRRNGRERARGGKDREEELPSTNRKDHHRQWETVIITGDKDGDWYGACYLADTITIPHSLVKNLKIPKRGSFYRIKCSMDYGRMIACDLNPDPVYPQDLEVHGNVDTSLQVWCYARIERSESKSFTLFNEILGEATLPHKFAHPEMRVGDEIEALYYRVKTTKNPTHWMVQRVGMMSSGSKRNQGRMMDENRERRRENEERGIPSEKKSGSRVDTETSQSSSRIEEHKDGRVLDIMRYFSSLPEIREIFKRGNSKDLERIDKILDRDRMRSLQ